MSEVKKILFLILAIFSVTICYASSPNVNDGSKIPKIRIGIVAVDESVAGVVGNIYSALDSLRLVSKFSRDYIDWSDLSNKNIKVVEDYKRKRDLGIFKEEETSVESQLMGVDYLLIIEKNQESGSSFRITLHVLRGSEKDYIRNVSKDEISKFLVDLFYNKLSWKADYELINEGKDKGKVMVLYPDPRGGRFGNIGLVKVTVYDKDGREICSDIRESIWSESGSKVVIPSQERCGKILSNKKEEVVVFVKPINAPVIKKGDYWKFDTSLIYDDKVSVLTGKDSEGKRYLKIISAKNDRRLMIYRIDAGSNGKFEVKLVNEFVDNVFHIGNKPLYLFVTDISIGTGIDLSSLENVDAGMIFINYDPNAYTGEPKVAKRNHAPSINVGKKDKVYIGDLIPVSISDLDGDEIIERKAYIDGKEVPIDEKGVVIPRWVVRGKNVTIKVEAKDSKGAEKTEEFNVQVVNRDPIIEVKGEVVRLKNGAVYPIKVEDPDGDEVSVSYSIYTEAGELVKSGESVIKLDHLKVGNYVLLIKADDHHEGKVQKRVTLIVENSPPIIKIPDFVEVENKGKVQLVAEDPDGDSIKWDVKTANDISAKIVLDEYLQLDRMVPGNVYKVKVIAMDMHGGQSEKIIDVKAENTPPVLKSIKGKDRVKSGDYFVISYEDIDGNVSRIEATVDGKEMKVVENRVIISKLKPEKNYTLHVKVIDKFGDFDEKERAFYLEDTPPSIELPEIIKVRNGELINVKATDPDDDTLTFSIEVPQMQKIYYKSSFRPMFFEPGEYDLLVTVRDSYGKYDSSKAKLVIINTPPRVKYDVKTSVENNYPTPPVKIRVAVEDPDGQVLVGTVYVDKSGTLEKVPFTFYGEKDSFSKTITLPISREGNYSVWVEVNDGVSVARTARKNVTVYDVPKIRLSHRRTGPYNSIVDISVVRIDAFKNIPVKYKVQVYKDDSLLSEFVTYKTSFSVKLEEVGSYDIFVTPINGTIYGKSEKISLYYKGIPPSKPIIFQPIEGEKVSGKSVLLRWKSKGKYVYKVYLGRTGQGMKLVADNLRCESLKLKLDPGVYRLKIIAYDSIGRYAESDVVTFEVVGYFTQIADYHFNNTVKLFEFNGKVYVVEGDKFYRLSRVGNTIDMSFYPTGIVKSEKYIVLYDENVGNLFIYGQDHKVFTGVDEAIDSVAIGKYVYVLSNYTLYVISTEGDLIKEYDLDLYQKGKIAVLSGYVLVTGKPGFVYLLDEETLKIRQQILDDYDDMAFVAVDESNSVLISMDSMGVVRYYKMKSGILKLVGAEGDVSINGVLYFSASDGVAFIQTVRNNRLYALNVEGRRLEFKIDLDGRVYYSALVKDMLLVVGDHFVNLYKIDQSEVRLVSEKGFESKIVSIVFLQRENQLFLSDETGNVMVYKPW